MTSRDLVIRTLNQEPVDRAPRDLWVSPDVESSRADETAEIALRFPPDVLRADFAYPPGERSKNHRTEGQPVPGTFTDAWGCPWQVDGPDNVAELLDPPLADAAKMDPYRPPLEVLDAVELGPVNRCAAATNRFVLGWTEVGPFSRLRALRGAEAAAKDLSRGSKRVRSLLGRLHDYFCREIEIWAGSDVDGVVLCDDWATADSLPIESKMWRELLRPLYRDYCKILQAGDKFAFFYAEGNVSDVFGDLVRVGFDAIRADLSVMDVERLAKRYRGRITFWTEIDRQHLVPHGNRKEIREAVRKIRRVLDYGSGGLIARCRWDPPVSLGNVAALFEYWMAPMTMRG